MEYGIAEIVFVGNGFVTVEYRQGGKLNMDTVPLAGIEIQYMVK